MKVLVIGEFRNGNVLDTTYETLAFAKAVGGDAVMFLVGNAGTLPAFGGTLYLADAGKYGDYNPAVHKALVLSVIEKEQPDVVVFPHSSYGWDLAPRVAFGWGAAQVSECIGVDGGSYVVGTCNAKLRRKVKGSGKTVVTIQVGAFAAESGAGSPSVVPVDTDVAGAVTFGGYEVAERTGVDLAKAEIIVSAGRGIGKPENVEIVQKLADALGGELGASRPVVDAGWVPQNRQVGTTGQTVSPKLYVAVGISGAIQHLAGMKKSDFIVAINTDKDAPIAEVADVLVIADAKTFLPVLTDKLAK